MAHLTKPQRDTIEAMLKEGHTQSEIARVIGKNKSVVSREIKRNRDLRSGSYSQDLAQRKYQKRQKEKPKRVRFTDAVKTEVETLLKEDYSPEQVVGTLKKVGKDTVSIETIYQYIWKNKKQGGTLHNICIIKAEGTENGVTPRTIEELSKTVLILINVQKWWRSVLVLEIWKSI